MAAMTAMTQQQQNEINVASLSIEQLYQFRQQHEEEISELIRQLEALVDAKNRFLTARSTLDDMSKAGEGEKLLIPLNSSLYVPGKVASPDKVVVELGTGYFCEKSVPAAKELIDRKLQLVMKSLETVEGVTNKKRKNMEQIIQIMQYKMSMRE